MRVAQSAKLIYLNPPRTASTTIAWQLKANRLNLWHPNEHSGHATVWKPEWRDYFVFISIRHPFTRAVSLWKRTVEALKYRSKRELEELQHGKISFEEHLFNEYYEPWWRNVVACQFAKGVPRVHLTVRQEKLREDFNNIPGVKWKRLPRGGRHKASLDVSPWYEHYTPRCIERVLDLFADDFLMYGYTKDFEKAKAGELFV